MDIILPGLMFVLQEVFPNVYGWRYNAPTERRVLVKRCANFITMVLQNVNKSDSELLLKKTCVYNLLHTENAVELLKIISVGEFITKQKINICKLIMPNKTITLHKYNA